MAIVSHLHHLFNAETCQSYIHTLRWKDRPLQCPRCQSHHVGPWGTYHYQPGLKRYRCKEKACKRTFNDLTGTLLDGSKRSVMYWILATFLLGSVACMDPPPMSRRNRTYDVLVQMLSCIRPLAAGYLCPAGHDAICASPPDQPEALGALTNTRV
jgi:transposase-like protein